MADSATQPLLLISQPDLYLYKLLSEHRKKIKESLSTQDFVLKFYEGKWLKSKEEIDLYLSCDTPVMYNTSKYYYSF